MFIHRRVLLPPSLLPLYMYFFFLSIFVSSLHCIPTALTITSSFTIAICWSVPAILINQLRIAYNDLLYLMIYLANVFRWPLSHLFIYTINTFVVPCLLFVILILKQPPDPYADLWHIPSHKPPKRLPPQLYGRSMCIFSALNSVNTFEPIHLEFSSQLHAQQTFFDQHINKSLPFPSIPSRLLHGGLQLLRSLPISDQSSLL